MSFITGFKQTLKSKIDGLQSGFKRHGDSFLYTRYQEDREYVSDYFIQFNIYNPYLTCKKTYKDLAYLYPIKSNKPFLVCEEGAFRQFPQYKRFGWFNYKNNLGIFNNENVDDYRWNIFKSQTNIQIKDWCSPGDNILIMGQLEHDSALIELYDAGYESFDDFVIQQIKKIRNYTDRPIVYRQHPLQKKNRKILQKRFESDTELKNVTLSENFNSSTSLNGGKGLDEDFKNAYCVITFNSNSGVESITKGIPTFSLSNTSSIYEISHTNYSQIENLNYNIDITKWCNKIAYTVWNRDEITKGMMWDHFKYYFEKINLNNVLNGI